MIDGGLTVPEAAEKARGGQDVQVTCPGHLDSSPSLSVAYSPGKGILLKCHAGCDTKDILAAVGWTWADLFDPDDNLAPDDTWTPAGTASHIYPYFDEQGTVRYEVLRVPQAGGGKTFFQRHYDDVQQKYVWNVRDQRRVLYQLPEVIRAVANGEVVNLAEGERDADTVRRMGLCCTTNAMGAGKWEDSYTEVLAGATVVILSDADAAGRAHVRMVRDKLIEVGCRVEVREPKPGYKDITEMHTKGGGGIEDMLVVVPFQDAERVKFGVDVLDIILRPLTSIEFVIPHTLARRERLILTGFEGMGKVLDVSTKIPTPSGFSTMGGLNVGDQVFDKDGRPCNVVAKSDVHIPSEGCFKLTFSDGLEFIAGGAHQWLTYTQAERGAEARYAKADARGLQPRGTRQERKYSPKVRVTEEIRETLWARPGFINHSIKVNGSLDLPAKDLPIDPYLLGVWLGDGTTLAGSVCVATRDWGIHEQVVARGAGIVSIAEEKNSCSMVRYEGLQAALRENDLLGNKHIPAPYLRASHQQRLDLLAGICDTDGFCNSRGEAGGRGNGQSVIEVTFMLENLAHDLMELIRSLGVIPSMYVGDATIDGVSYGPKYRVVFTSPFNPFLACEFKRDRWRPLRTARSQHRYINSVERVPDRWMQCIQVDSPDGTYLAGEELLVTHNSNLMRQISVMVAAGIHPFTLQEIEPKNVLYIDAENEPGQTLQSWQDLIGLAAYHGHPVERGMLTILEEWDNSDLDMSSRDGHSWLHERVHAYQPDLVLMGPLTNMVGRDLKDDEPVRKLKAAVNSARTICGSAFIMEHHAPHRNPSDKRRSVRPYGSSMFLKWPDYGYGLAPSDIEGTFTWERTRWPRVRTRSWPGALRWGVNGEWPWVECEPPE